MGKRDPHASAHDRAAIEKLVSKCNDAQADADAQGAVGQAVAADTHF